MTDKRLNANGLQLKNQLATAKKKDQEEYQGNVINVAGVGGIVSAAYEQLRNAAEYAQEHLLIQNAIRRFYIRNLSFGNPSEVSKTIAEELIIELTQAGYLKNNTQPVEVIDKLGSAVIRHYGNYWRLRTTGVDANTAEAWTLDLASIESEDMLVKNEVQSVYLQFAYHHYQSILHKNQFVTRRDDDVNFDVCIYMAVHRALLKSDLAAIRSDMQKLYKTSDSNVNDYAAFHKNIDELYGSEVTNKLTRYINKYGAPLRVLRSMIQENENVSEILEKPEHFNEEYKAQIKKEYRRSESKLNRGLIKSILFLLITKSLIGIAIEAPYDLATTGEILMVPLLVNLFTPIVYLLLIRIGFKLPGEANARAMVNYADDILYNDQPKTSLYPVKERTYPFGFKIAYALLFLSVFSLVTYLLFLVNFSIVQGVIFFVFLAAASFLGLGLSRIVREMELVPTKPGALGTFWELLFTPFTFLGKWISEKYQKMNIVALVMDTLIEMPLKTALRLLRQWTGFINEKKDEI